MIGWHLERVLAGHWNGQSRHQRLSIEDILGRVNEGYERVRDMYLHRLCDHQAAHRAARSVSIRLIDDNATPRNRAVHFEEPCCRTLDVKVQGMLGIDAQCAIQQGVVIERHVRDALLVPMSPTREMPSELHVV